MAKKLNLIPKNILTKAPSAELAPGQQDMAYRAIFIELKELIEQDIGHEEEIKLLEKQIKKDVDRLIVTQNKLLEALHHAVKLGQITSEGVAEVLEHLEES